MLFRLNKAIRLLSRNKKIVVYGTDAVAREACRFLRSHRIPVLYFIDDRLSVPQIDTVPVRNKYDLLLENKEDIFILSCKDCVDYRTDILPFFFQLDLFFEKDFLNIYGAGEEYIRSWRAEKTFVFDTNLGLSRIDDLPGFKIFGNKENKNAKIIVTLGGSTTDPYINNWISWSEYLYRKLSAVDKNIVIYCGGFSGYISSQELIKLIRDVLPLSPYAVISYSGVNDMKRPPFHPFSGRYKRPFVSEHQYNFYNNTCLNHLNNAVFLTGVQNDKTPAENWVECESIMYCIAEEFHFHFMGILQPSFHIGICIKPGNFTYFADEVFGLLAPDCDGYSLPLDEYKKNYEEAKAKVKNHDFILDYTDIFDGLDSPYYDACHVTSRGNNIIANRIVKDLIRRNIIPGEAVK
jgi:hypothetical protein